jgi:hypothetical protein
MDAVESRCAKVDVGRRKEDGVKLAAAVAEDSNKSGGLWLWYGRGSLSLSLLFQLCLKTLDHNATAES